MTGRPQQTLLTVLFRDALRGKLLQNVWTSEVFVVLNVIDARWEIHEGSSKIPARLELQVMSESGQITRIVPSCSANYLDQGELEISSFSEYTMIDSSRVADISS